MAAQQISFASQREQLLHAKVSLERRVQDLHAQGQAPDDAEEQLHQSKMDIIDAYLHEQEALAKAAAEAEAQAQAQAVSPPVPTSASKLENAYWTARAALSSPRPVKVLFTDGTAPGSSSSSSGNGSGNGIGSGSGSGAGGRLLRDLMDAASPPPPPPLPSSPPPPPPPPLPFAATPSKAPAPVTPASYESPQFRGKQEST